MCDDPALATHVRFLEPQLVARLAELAGDRHINGCEVRVERRRARSTAASTTGREGVTRRVSMVGNVTPRW